jgi:hypothetical protein
VRVWFSFSSEVDAKRFLQRISDIKTQLRVSWEALQKSPADPLRALQFIHAAFEAERGNSEFVMNLLKDRVLIDLASTLLLNTTEPQRICPLHHAYPMGGKSTACWACR